MRLHAWGSDGLVLRHGLSCEVARVPLANARRSRGSFDWYPIPLQDADYAKTTMPVERIQGPVLTISGVDDGLWPSTELTEFAVRRLKQKGFAHRFEHLSYPGAGHSIAWPNSPTTMLKFKHPVSGGRHGHGWRARGDGPSATGLAAAHARLLAKRVGRRLKTSA